MTLHLFKTICRSATHLVRGSAAYDWSLRGDAPDRLVVRPVDPWPGNVEAGQYLYDGAFMLGAEDLMLRPDCWEPHGVSPAWLEHMHGFSWLRDLRAVGGEQARSMARLMVMRWMETYDRWHRLAWRPDIAGQRLSLWIALYEFFGAGAEEEFHDTFMDSAFRQARHVSRALPGDIYGVGLLRGAKGLLYAGLAFEGRESWIEQALDIFSFEIGEQILPDGAHISRCPSQMLEAMQILIDLRTALAAAGHPLPEGIQFAIDRMGPALRFFRMSDKYFALFNGTQKGSADLIDRVLGQAGTRSKALQSLPCAGYERASLGRTQIIFDGGKTPPSPYDGRAHAAPLAFEMAYAKERIFVSCGSHPTEEEWRDALRATAAHTALTIDNRNACEIARDGHIARRVRHALMIREDSKNACLLEASHDGYVPLNGITHRRRLYLSDQGNDLRGEDTLVSMGGRPLRGHGFAIRFHIHPRVLVSLIQGGEAALLRLQSGIGWRFSHAGGKLALENSIYLSEGSRPRKTKQLVIYAQTAEEQMQVKWAVQREGL